jgi:hypothetical protein
VFTVWQARSHLTISGNTTFTIPTKTLRRFQAESLLYKIHSYGIEGAEPAVDHLANFEEFYTSPRKMVRVFKVLNVDMDSKQHPVGSYPPALAKVMEEMHAFGSRPEQQ